LKIKAVEVEAKKKVADEKAEVIGVEKAKVEIENNKATIEADKCTKIQTDVDAELAVVQKELDAAIPLVEKAEKALAGLNIKDFQFLKSLPSPHPAIETVFFCVCQLLAGIHPDIPVDKNKKLKETKTWKISQKLMQDPKGFIDNYLNPFKDKVVAVEVVPHGFKAIRDILAQESFNPTEIGVKSACAAGVCDWVINIVAYYDVVVTVEPKKIAVAAAKEALRQANEKKAEVDALVAKLNAELAILQADF
jgi:dynein heavy chain, axonemal